MNKTLVFHSYKGGTGKTTIAANLAVIYSLRKRNVCLLDFDFRAPSLHAMFGKRPRAGTWLNNFLNGECHIFDTLHDMKLHEGGRLTVGFANPTSDAMWDMNKRDQKWWGKILRRLLDAKSQILRQLGFDLIIIDSSPGVQDSAMNALAVSDLIVLTLKQNELDVEGTRELVTGFHEKLGRGTALILNKVLSQSYESISNEEKRDLSSKVQKTFGFPVLAVIPCFCDLSMEGSHILYSLEKPDHPFVERISTIADGIEKLF